MNFIFWVNAVVQCFQAGEQRVICHSWHFVNEIIMIGLILVNVLGSFVLGIVGKNNSTEIYIYKKECKSEIINKAIESNGTGEAHV